MTPRTTTVFKSGNSQAVRIPKDLAFSTDKVTIEVAGDALILRPQPLTMQEFLDGLPRRPGAFDNFPDFEDEIDEEPVPQW